MHEHVGKSNAVRKYVLPSKDYTRVTRGTGTTLGTTTVTVTGTVVRFRFRFRFRSVVLAVQGMVGWSLERRVVDNRSFGHRLPYRVCVNNETLCYV